MNKRSLRKRRSSKQSQNRRSRLKTRDVDYQLLEPRQLLATDVGLQFSGATLGTETTSLVSNVQGDIGPNHYVEVVEGAMIIYNRNTGTRVRTMTMDNFFLQAGAFVPSTTHDPQIIYDHQTQRWIAAARGTGGGNWLHVAISDTSDPTGQWEAVQFVGDSQGITENRDITLSVDKDAVYLATNNTGPFGDDVSLYSIPLHDLLLDNPTITNMSRFEKLNGYGRSLQVAINFEDSDGKATVVGSGGPGTVILADLTGTSAAGAALSAPTPIYVALNVVDPTGLPVPLDQPIANTAPSATDPAGVELNINHDITGSIYEWKGSIWGAMTFTTNFDAFGGQVPDDSGDFQHGVLWFEIDVNLKDLVTQDRGPNAYPIYATNSDTIEQTFFNPSVAVNEYGVLAIQFNSVTVDLEADDADPIGQGEFINTVTVVGTVTNGLNKRAVFHDDPFMLQAGLGPFDPAAGDAVPWGDSTAIRVDPVESNTFWGIAPFANTGNRWTTEIAKIKPFDLAPYIEADAGNNEITLRRMPENTDLLEVIMDGETTDVLPYEVLGVVSIMGHAGADHFLLDYTAGDPETSGGFVMDGGFGTDIIETNDPVGASFLNDKYDHPTFGDSYPVRLFPYIFNDRDVPVADDPTLGAPDGIYNGLSEYIDIEELRGGPGDDSFRFEEGYMLGSALGRGGDDRFEFAGNIIDDVTGDFVPDWTGAIGESVDGGTGYNTLDFTDLQLGAGVRVLGAAEFDGFDGNTSSLTFTSFHLQGGPIGGDNPTDQWRNISNLRGSNNDSDVLTGMNAYTLVTVDDEESTYQADGAIMNFFHWENIFTSEFDDDFNVLSNTLEPLRLNGLAGDDHYRFSSDAPGYEGNTDGIGGLIFALGGEGANTMVVSNFSGSETDVLILAQRISGMGEIVYNAIGGTFDLTVFTSQFDDFLRIHSFDRDNTLIVRSFHGDDLYSIEDLSKASVKLYGGEGDDTYVIERIQDIDFRNLEIFDSLGRERDRVTLAGTVLPETWVIDAQTFEDLDVAYEGIEVFGVEGRGGNDTFYVRDSIYELFLDGGDGNDIFFVGSEAPIDLGTTALIEQRLNIDGGSGTNAMYINNRSGNGTSVEIGADSIVGLFPMPMSFTATGGTFAAINSQFAGIRIKGSETGDDTFNINEFLDQNDLLIEGLGGADRFKIKAEVLADIVIDGGDDGDIYNVYFVGGGNRQVSITDFGIGGANRMEFYGNDNNETITVSNFAVERFDELVSIAGEFSFLSVDTYLGDDQISLANSLAATNYLRAGDGRDTITINGTDGVRGVHVFAGAGVDQISLLDVNENSFSRVWGEAGDDVITVRQDARGNVKADGGEDSDRVVVDLVGSGDRYVDARDTGLVGFDTLIVNATTAHDDLELRRTRVFEDAEKIAYDERNERLELDTAEGNDTLTMFYSSAVETQISTFFGSDSIDIRSTGPTAVLNIDTGSGNDSVIVRSTKEGTETTINGREGDDTFNVGYNKLGRIRGHVAIVGGENSFSGEDRLILSDSASGGRLDYRVGPTSVVWTSGPTNAQGQFLFAGVSYDSTMEFVRVNGTALANNFVVTPSQNTRFYIFGDAPLAGEAEEDSINLQQATLHGAQLHITDEAFGKGFWDFTDGSEIVEFEGIEATFQ